MQTRDKRTQRDYTLAFKLSVVEQVEKGELTYKQAQAKYGYPGPLDGIGVAAQAWTAWLGACGIICSHAH